MGLPTIQPANTTTEYTTPDGLFEQLWEEAGGFDFDPCCRPYHHTAVRIIRAGGTICIPPSDGPGHINPRILTDGLAQPWHGKVFMNPPYGPALRQWVPKAVHEVEVGNAELVVALLPAKTEVQWWQEYVLQSCLVQQLGDEFKAVVDKHPLCHTVRFLKGRLHFGGGEGPARVGSVIVVWRC